MNINYILELLRDSMLDVIEIKNAVSGHIYSSYLTNNSRFPCITLYFITGSSPVQIEGAINAVIQVKIWTDNNINPYKQLYEIYDHIILNFGQKYKENDSLKMSTKLGNENAEHPPVLYEKYNNIDLYSLPIKIHCRAIFN